MLSPAQAEVGFNGPIDSARSTQVYLLVGQITRGRGFQSCQDSWNLRIEGEGWIFGQIRGGRESTAMIRLGRYLRLTADTVMSQDPELLTPAWSQAPGVDLHVIQYLLVQYSLQAPRIAKFDGLPSRSLGCFLRRTFPTDDM